MRKFTLALCGDKIRIFTHNREKMVKTQIFGLSACQIQLIYLSIRYARDCVPSHEEDTFDIRISGHALVVRARELVTKEYQNATP